MICVRGQNVTYVNESPRSLAFLASLATKKTYQGVPQMDDEQYLHFKDHQWAFDPTLRPFDNTTSRSSRVIAVFLFPYGFAYFIRLWGGLLLRFFFIFIIVLQWMGQRFNRGTLWWIKGLRVWHPTALVSLHPKFCLARRADSQAFKASLSCVAWSKDEFTMTAVTSVVLKNVNI